MNSDNRNIDFFHEEEQEFNLKEVIFKYTVHWKWFLLSLGMALIFAFFYLKFQTPLYKIQSSILIKDEKKGLGQDAALKELDLFASNKIVENEIEILKSYTLSEKVVRNLNLHIRYFTNNGFRDMEVYKESPLEIELFEPNALAYEEPLEFKIEDRELLLNKVQIATGEVIETPYGMMKVLLRNQNPEINSILVKVSPIENVVEGLMQKIIIEPSGKTSTVITLSMEDAVPEKGKAILNKLIDSYNEAALEDKNQVAANTLVFIEERLRLISNDLELVEKNVENFKIREGITDISTEAGLFLQNIQDVDNRLYQVKIQQSVLDNIETYVRNKEGAAGTVPATLGISDPTLLSLIGKLTELEMQKERNVKLTRADNPLVIALEDQIRGLKASIYENIQSLKQNLALTRQQLEKQGRRMEDMIRTIPGKERALVDISREQAIKNNLFIYLLQKREETAISYASAVSDSRTIDGARSSLAPVKPVKRNIFLLFTLIGLALPFATIYSVDLLNDKVKRRREIEKATQAPILADIHYAQHYKPFDIAHSGKSLVAEQIRTLRTNLSYLMPGDRLQTILFTSSMSGEGKSFISLNLGASLAMTDKKTIILEMDMRKPKLHTGLKMTNKKGISNYLIGKAELKDIIRPISEQPNFYIITCGPLPPNPVELLVKGRLEELFRELRQEFDYIIIDAPPVGVVTDAQILEKQANATLFVVRHNYTPKERLKAIDVLYREGRFKNMNLIFNAIKESRKYGYGYGYYADDHVRKNNWLKNIMSRKPIS